MSAHKRRDEAVSHEVDFRAWANEQAALLRAGRLSELDLANVAEEIEQRRALAIHLKENPSLVQWKFEAVADAYETAVIRAEAETNMLRDMFPWSCSYSFEQILDPAFWPEPQ